VPLIKMKFLLSALTMLIPVCDVILITYSICVCMAKFRNNARKLLSSKTRMVMLFNYRPVSLASNLPPNHLNITFYPTFHHLLPILLTTNLALNKCIELTSVFFTNCIFLCEKSIQAFEAIV